MSQDEISANVSKLAPKGIGEFTKLISVRTVKAGPDLCIAAGHVPMTQTDIETFDLLVVDDSDEALKTFAAQLMGATDYDSVKVTASDGRFSSIEKNRKVSWCQIPPVDERELLRQERDELVEACAALRARCDSLSKRRKKTQAFADQMVSERDRALVALQSESKYSIVLPVSSMSIPGFDMLFVALDSHMFAVGDRVIVMTHPTLPKTSDIPR